MQLPDPPDVLNCPTILGGDNGDLNCCYDILGQRDGTYFCCDNTKYFFSQIL
jgi:hypothetical protein